MATVDVTRIASNIGALNALNSLQNINKQLATHQGRLQTGKRINSAADDPAGLTIATKMLARSEGMKVALGNISDAKNMLSVAESGLSKMSDIMVQMRSKAEQAASDTLGTSERDAIATQLSAYANQIDSMVTETKWNGVQLLDGSVNKRFQTGVDNGEYTQWILSSKFDPTSLGISTVVANDQTSNLAGSTTAITAANQTSNFAGLSKVSTGAYTATVQSVSASATVGTASVITNSTIAVTVGTANNTGSEIANGAHTINFIGYVAGTNTLTYNIDGGANTTQVMTTNAATNLGATGLTLNAGGTDDTTSDAAWASVIAGSNKSINLDYVKSNTAKFTLKTGSGELLGIDTNGTNDTVNSTSTTGYATLGAAFNTGRGISLTFAASGSVAANDLVSFDYKQANNYSVDVSTASRAGSYMSTVQSALDTVTGALSTLGSLMARMDFKEEQVANAQVNVEASYSRIMNANMAEEQVNASKFAILQQTATAMLAQANQAPQSLLSLFR